MVTFDEIRLEIERTLAAEQEAEGQNKWFLLRRLHRLITWADRAASGDYRLNLLADNVATPKHLATLWNLVKIAMDAAKLKNGDQSDRKT